MWTLLAALAAAADCPQPVDSAQLATAIGAADGAFSGMDLDGFESARVDVRDQLPCLSEPVTPADAAGVHRLEAYASFVAEDREAVVAAFMGVLGAQPRWSLSSSIAPDGHPLRDAFEEAAGRPRAPEDTLAPARDASLFVDGRRATTRPTDRPAVVQLVADDGAVEWTSYLASGAPLPDYETGGRHTTTASTTRKRPVIVLAAAGGAAVATGVLYTAALTSRSAFDDSGTPYEDLERLRRRTNTLYFTSVGTGLAAAGLGITAAVTW